MDPEVFIELSYDVIYNIIIENHKFSKYSFFYNLLNPYKNEIIKREYIVKHLIRVISLYGKNIFEIIGTEDPYTFWGNMEIYFEDKVKTLNYLWEYSNDFKPILLKLFGKKQTFFTKKTFESQTSSRFCMVNKIGFFADLVYPPATLNLDLTYKMGVVFKIKTGNLLVDLPQGVISSLSTLKRISQFITAIDYEMFLIYEYIKYLIKAFRSYPGVYNNTIKFLLKISKFQDLENHRDFIYLVMDATFYIFYVEIFHNFLVFDFEIFHNFLVFDVIKKMIELYKQVGRNEKLKIPEPLKTLKYHLKFKSYRVLEIREDCNQFVDPKRVLTMIGTRTRPGVKKADFRYLLFHHIFGLLFLESSLKRWKIPSFPNVKFGLNIQFQLKQALIISFKEINPRLEKMLVEGSLDPKVFLSPIRLFNELYTISYIFPYIVENKNEVDFLNVLDQHFKMLIFINPQERNIFEQNIKSMIQEIDQERLNTYIVVKIYYDTDLEIIEGLDTYLNLYKLDLGRNRITKIEGLDKLTKLDRLNLYFNQITKIEGLDNLTKLNILTIGENEITKIEGLDKLINLKRLDLDYNKITKIEGLDKLINLRELDLEGNHIKEIKGLDNLINLELFKILNNDYITKIKGLDKLTKLSMLNLSGNKITKIENLDKLTNLTRLHLEYNEIKKIEGLDKLIKLELLHLGENQLSKIEGLENLTNLRKLILKDNQIKWIEGLNNLKKMELLNIIGNQIKDFSYLIPLKERGVKIICDD